MCAARTTLLVAFALIWSSVTASPCKAESPSGKAEPGDVTTNSIGMKLVWIPAGKMKMGSPPEEPHRWECENQVDVEITKPFLMGQTEVTQQQWQRVMNTTPWRGSGQQGHIPVKELPECAASYISWEQAAKFCDALTRLEIQSNAIPHNTEYSLPTEAQWEYACRTGGATAFSFWVMSPQQLVNNDYAWWLLTQRESYPHPVASKRPNRWNLYDMHGNVEEWCLDWYADNLQGGLDPKGPKAGANRVLRGGSWSSTPDKCRSASRGEWSPQDAEAGPWHGFRVVRVDK